MSLTEEEREIANFIINLYSETPRLAKNFLKRKFSEIPDLMRTLPRSVKYCTVEKLLQIISWAYENGYLS